MIPGKCIWKPILQKTVAGRAQQFSYDSRPASMAKSPVVVRTLPSRALLPKNIAPIARTIESNTRKVRSRNTNTP